MITFQCADLTRNVKKKKELTQWLNGIAKRENFRIEELNYIFCSDEYLYRMNVEYLNHHTYTDIITFDNGDGNGSIEGDIFISLERVSDNAQTFGVSFDEELLRVISHGLLHLCGYKDKSPADTKKMRTKENQCLSYWKN